MTRLQTTFSAPIPAFVAFITAGDDALHAVVERAKGMDQDQIVLMNLCGRGDKDIFTVADKLGVEM